MSTKIFNLDSLRNIQADKSYYLSSTTGEIKEAGFWHKVKCLFSTTERLKASHLMDAIKASLLEQEGLASNVSLDASFQKIEIGANVKGSIIKDVLRRFQSSDPTRILQQSARRVAEQTVPVAAKGLETRNPKATAQAMQILCAHVFKGLTNSKELPYTTNLDNEKILDNNAFIKEHLRQGVKTIQNLIDEITQDDRLGQPSIDARYAKHIVNTLFNKDGTRNNKTIDDLKTPIQVRVDDAFKLNEKLMNSRPHIVHGMLLKDGIDPAEKLQQILDFCGDNKLLQGVAIEIAPALCYTSNNDLRTDEAIQKKLNALKESIREMRLIERNTPGVIKSLCNALTGMDGTPFPPGLLNTIARVVANAPVKALTTLNGLSPAEDIHEAIEEIRNAMHQFKKLVNVDEQFRAIGENEFGGPHQQACDMAFMTLLLAKIGPAAKTRLVHALQSNECSQMLAYLNILANDMKVKDNTIVTDPNRRKAISAYIEDDQKIIDELVIALNEGLEHPIVLEAEEHPDVGNQSIGYMVGNFNDSYDKA